MPAPSNSQKSDLDSNIENTNGAIAYVQQLVKQHQLPFDYNPAYTFMNAQKTAAQSLRDTGNLGCSLESVSCDQTKIDGLVATQHLKNQAFLVSKVAQLEEAQQTKALEEAKSITHEIKSKLSSAAGFMSDDLNRIVGELASQRGGQKGGGKKPQR